MARFANLFEFGLSNDPAAGALLSAKATEEAGETAALSCSETFVGVLLE